MYVYSTVVVNKTTVLKIAENFQIKLGPKSLMPSMIASC